MPKIVKVQLGEKFNKLTVLKQIYKNRYLFKCDCGNEKVLNIYKVRSGETTSCSCARFKEYISIFNNDKIIDFNFLDGSGIDYVIFKLNDTICEVHSNGDIFIEKLSPTKVPYKKKLIFSKQKNGYLYIVTKNFKDYVHRIVAKCFIPNPKNLPCINHKDGNKQNNHINNLEWCSYSQNLYHSYEVLKRKTPSGKYFGGGVAFLKDRNCWVAYCDYKSKRTYLGYYTNEREARIIVKKFRENLEKEQHVKSQETTP